MFRCDITHETYLGEYEKNMEFQNGICRKASHIADQAAIVIEGAAVKNKPTPQLIYIHNIKLKLSAKRVLAVRE